MPFRRLRPYKFRGLLWAALGFVGLTTLAMGYTVWQLRSDAIDDAYKDTSNVATVLSEQVAQTVRSIDLVLTDIQERIALLGVRTPDDLQRIMSTETGHALLKGRIDRFPLADVITVVDANGRLVSTSRMAIVADRPLGSRLFSPLQGRRRQTHVHQLSSCQPSDWLADGLFRQADTRWERWAAWPRCRRRPDRAVPTHL
jgi:hypothetical protein